MRARPWQSEMGGASAAAAEAGLQAGVRAKEAEQLAATTRTQLQAAQAELLALRGKLTEQERALGVAESAAEAQRAERTGAERQLQAALADAQVAQRGLQESLSAKSGELQAAESKGRSLEARLQEQAARADEAARVAGSQGEVKQSALLAAPLS